RPQGQHDDLARVPGTRSCQGRHRRPSGPRHGSSPPRRHAGSMVAPVPDARTSDPLMSDDQEPVKALPNQAAGRIARCPKILQEEVSVFPPYSPIFQTEFPVMLLKFPVPGSKIPCYFEWLVST